MYLYAFSAFQEKKADRKGKYHLKPLQLSPPATARVLGHKTPELARSEVEKVFRFVVSGEYVYIQMYVCMYMYI